MFKVAPEPLTAGKAQEYHVKEFIAAEKNYWKEHEQIPTAWQGRMVETFALSTRSLVSNSSSIATAKST